MSFTTTAFSKKTRHSQGANMLPIDKRWRKSQLYHDAYMAWGANPKGASEFEYSDEFRNARHAFRKEVNGSKDIEAC